MKEKYLETLVAQMRARRAREAVRREVSGHIEEQKEAYMAQGMDADKAEQQAVMDMGDPVEAGALLDRMHRPKPAWGFLAMAAVLCIAGVVLQYTAGQNMGAQRGIPGSYFFERQCLYAVLGFLLMCAVYFVDYTWLARYARQLGICMLVFTALGLMMPADFGFVSNAALNGRGRWICVLDRFYISVDAVLYMYVPVFGAVLYHYRSIPKKQLWKPALFLIVPLYLAARAPGISLLANLVLAFAVLISAAVLNGWLGSCKKRLLAVIWTVVIVCPAVFLSARAAGGSYVQARLAGWLHGGENGYVYGIIRNILDASRLVGANTAQPVDGYLPSVSSDYLLTYLISSYGILAATALVLLLLSLGAVLLHACVRQKNMCGRMIGLGAGMMPGIQAVEYILMNLGLMPATTAYLPLLSFGGSGMLQACMLLGLLLSIYRYRDV